jgi:transposase
LQSHPGVEVITRDRSTEYTRGATLGAPQARQIADRFHLAGNLREALERLLDRNRSQLRGFALPRRGSTDEAQQAVPPAAQRQPTSRSPNESALRQAHRSVKQQQYEEVRYRHEAGESIRGIATQMKLSRGTVYRHLRSDSDPTARQIRRKPSMLDRYLPYLYRRWQGGCENGLQLWREIKAQGYPSSRKMVAAWVAQQREMPAKNGPRKYQTPEQRQTPPSSKGLSYFLLRESQELNLAEKAALRELKERSSEIATGYELAQEFMQMVRQLSGAQL